MEILNRFHNILNERNKEWLNISWCLRQINPQVGNSQIKSVGPKKIKENVLKTNYIRNLAEQISQKLNIPIENVYLEIEKILNEIGFDKDLKIIRSLAFVLVQTFKQIYNGIYVNELALNQVKMSMGENPVIFLPTHRSYMDFILMSFIFFNYDIQIPAIAAGMDFYHMLITGNLLRKTGAFYMRRQFSNNDPLYSKVFQQYVKELVLNGDHAINFFIEGTRSRSSKSLPPKFGLLSMVLKPYFFGQVSNLTIVPISISYDRILEEKLFAAEILGVPKPKESTKGLFKALRILKEHYGNIYVNFSDPIDVKRILNRSNNHNLGSIDEQHLDSLEIQQIQSLAYNMIELQQKNSVINLINLIALILNNQLIENSKNVLDARISIDLNELSLKIIDCLKVFDYFGAIASINKKFQENDTNTDLNNNEVITQTKRTNDEDLKLNILNIVLNVNKNLFCLNSNKIELLQCDLNCLNISESNVKGYRLSDQLLNKVLPLIQLQMYSNPCMCYLIGPALIVNVLFNQVNLNKDTLLRYFKFLRMILSNEFVIHVSQIEKEFNNSFKFLLEMDLLDVCSDIILIKTHFLNQILKNCLQPFLPVYKIICHLFLKEKEVLVKGSLKIIQKYVMDSLDSGLHPNNLSLETIQTVLHTYVQYNLIEITDQKIYKANEKSLANAHNLIDQVVPSSNYQNWKIISKSKL